MTEITDTYKFFETGSMSLIELRSIVKNVERGCKEKTGLYQRIAKYKKLILQEFTKRGMHVCAKRLPQNNYLLDEKDFQLVIEILSDMDSFSGQLYTDFKDGSEYKQILDRLSTIPDKFNIELMRDIKIVVPEIEEQVAPARKRSNSIPEGEILHPMTKRAKIKHPMHPTIIVKDIATEETIDQSLVQPRNQPMVTRVEPTDGAVQPTDNRDQPMVRRGESPDGRDQQPSGTHLEKESSSREPSVNEPHSHSDSIPEFTQMESDLAINNCFGQGEPNAEATLSPILVPPLEESNIQTQEAYPMATFELVSHISIEQLITTRDPSDVLSDIVLQVLPHCYEVQVLLKKTVIFQLCSSMTTKFNWFVREKQELSYLLPDGPNEYYLFLHNHSCLAYATGSLQNSKMISNGKVVDHWVIPKEIVKDVLESILNATKEEMVRFQFYDREDHIIPVDKIADLIKVSPSYFNRVGNSISRTSVQRFMTMCTDIQMRSRQFIHDSLNDKDL